jgi:hypothetical protein
MLVEALALDKFHGVENPAVGKGPDVMDGNDAGMLKLSKDTSLAEKAIGKIARGAGDVQDFQSHAALEFFIFGGKYNAHAAASDAFEKSVTCPGEIGHFRGIAETLENLVGKKFHLASQPKTAWASR